MGKFKSLIVRFSSFALALSIAIHLFFISLLFIAETIHFRKIQTIRELLQELVASLRHPTLDTFFSENGSKNNSNLHLDFQIEDLKSTNTTLGGVSDPYFSGFINPEKEISKTENSEPFSASKSSKANDPLIKPEELAEPSETCEIRNSFGGIGVHFETTAKPGEIGLTVKLAPKYYPAYKAGIRDGDQILGDLNKIRGEIGTFVDVQFIHNGFLKTTKIQREKICFKIDLTEKKKN